KTFILVVSPDSLKSTVVRCSANSAAKWGNSGACEPFLPLPLVEHVAVDLALEVLVVVLEVEDWVPRRFLVAHGDEPGLRQQRLHLNAVASVVELAEHQRGAGEVESSQHRCLATLDIQLDDVGFRQRGRGYDVNLVGVAIDAFAEYFAHVGGEP